jgi:hypothetical protein
MQILSSSTLRRSLFSLAAIGAFLSAASVVANDDAGNTAPTAATKPDARATGKPAEKPADKPKRIVQSTDGSVVLSGRYATIHGAKLRYEREKDTLGYWFNADDWVSWEFEITQPRKFFVDLEQSCGPESAGSHYSVEVGDQKLTDKVQPTGSFRLFRFRRIGTLQFEKPGVYTLTLRVQDKPQLAVMDLRAIQLSPLNPAKPSTAPPGGKKPAAATSPAAAKD